MAHAADVVDFETESIFSPTMEVFVDTESVNPAMLSSWELILLVADRMLRMWVEMLLVSFDASSEWLSIRREDSFRSSEMASTREAVSATVTEILTSFLIRPRRSFAEFRMVSAIMPSSSVPVCFSRAVRSPWPIAFAKAPMSLIGLSSLLVNRDGDKDEKS